MSLTLAATLLAGLAVLYGLTMFLGRPMRRMTRRVWRRLRGKKRSGFGPRQGITGHGGGGLVKHIRRNGAQRR